MTTLIFRAGENPTQCSQIPLGIRAENEVTQVALDFSPWAEEFGAGIVQLLVRRDGDSSPYPVVLTQSGTTATWTVSATDLAANGPLQAEFIYTVGTLVKKSEVLRFYVLRDIGAPGSAPDPYETWLDTLTEIAAQAQQDAADAEAAAQAIQDMGVQANTLEPGSYATVEKIVDPDTGAVTLVFGIPRGQDGSGGGDELWEAGTGTDAIAAKTASDPESPNTASGNFALAAGYKSIASGVCSFAMGQRTSGTPTTASGQGSFAQGLGTEASGAAAQAMGQKTEAAGNFSHAAGVRNQAKGMASTVFGAGNIAAAACSFVFGKYNVEDENGDDGVHGTNTRKFLLILGNGTADNARSNAMTVDWAGNEVLAGKLTLGAGPTEDMDAATKQYADRALPKAGGTMSGAIAMGSNKITGLANAENDGDAVNLGQVSGLISTNTAFFRGSFATKAALTAVAWQTSDPAAANYVTNNDYAVVLDDESQSDECWRYVYVAGTGWQAQYRINESPLTTAQLAALNSGATAQNISSISEKYVKPSGGIPAADLAPGVIPTVPSAYASNPAALGTAAPGSSGDYARGDHVHDFNSDFVTALLQLASKVAYVDDGGETYYAALEAALTHRVLSSISAVYTQNGTVLDTDSLDSLKSDLIVTAHYSDGSTATVASSAYTLSGTLEVGTSTITVSYGGKTDTFDVVVSLPTLDDIAYGTLTYRDIFITNNLLPFGDFEPALNITSSYVNWNGNANRKYKANAGSPTQSTAKCNSPSKSLKCFGSSAQQITYSDSTVHPTGDYICAMSVNIPRYASGNGSGVAGVYVQAGVSLGTNRIAQQTDGFEERVVILNTGTSSTNTFSIYVGSSGDSDAYVDDVVFSPLPSGMTLEKAQALYEKYCEIRRAS